MSNNLATLFLSTALLTASIAYGEKPAEGSVVERNQNPLSHNTSVRVFLNNLNPPVVRIRPDRLTWIKFPEAISVCENRDSYILTSEVGKKSENNGSKKILSIQVDFSKLSDAAKTVLQREASLPKFNINCLIGNNKSVVVFFEIDYEGHILVDLKYPKRMSMGRLERGSSESNDSDSYELSYFKPLKKISSKELARRFL